MSADGSAETALELSARRLERAVAQLEQRIARKLTAANEGAGSAFEEDRARLAADLDAARMRERELEEAGAAASEALAQAITEIRRALGDAELAAGGHAVDAGGDDRDDDLDATAEA